MTIAGNLWNFDGGQNVVDPTGSLDSSSGIQAAFNSNHLVWAPPGLYKVDQETSVDIPKVIECGLSIVTGWDDGSGSAWPILQEQQARFFTTQNITPFRLHCEQVLWRGGLLDCQQVTDHDVPAFLWDQSQWNPNHQENSRAVGWGGGLQGVIVLGNVDTLRDNPVSAGLGTVAMKTEFTPPSGWPAGTDGSYRNAYMTAHHFDIRGFGCRRVYQAGPRHVSSQWHNTCHVRVKANHCQTAVYDEATDGTQFFVSHDAGNVFNSAADADITPSVYMHPGSSQNKFYQPIFNDFQDGELNGAYYNRKTVDDTASNYWYGLSDEAITRAIGIRSSQLFQLYNQLRFRDNAHYSAGPQTRADLLNPNSFVNQNLKEDSVEAFVTDAGIQRPVWSTGSNPSDNWNFSDGAPLT